jgi:hypothetical protein
LSLFSHDARSAGAGGLITLATGTLWAIAGVVGSTVVLTGSTGAGAAVGTWAGAGAFFLKKLNIL